MKRNLLGLFLVLAPLLFFTNRCLAVEVDGQLIENTDKAESKNGTAGTNDKAQKLSVTEKVLNEANELATQADKLYEKTKKLKDINQTSTNSKENNTYTNNLEDEAKTLQDNILGIEKNADSVKKKAANLLNSLQPPPPSKSPYFLLTGGVVTLSPYKIVKLTPDGGPITFELAPTDGSDTTYFIDANFKYRRAWLKRNKSPKVWWKDVCEGGYWSGAVRFGITGADKDPTTSVAAGTGNAYAEVNFGPDFSLIEIQDKDPYVSLGFPDFIYGVTTDKGNQTTHKYYGIGALLTFGFPRTLDSEDMNKMIEVLFGIYPFAKLDVPDFVDKTSSVINEKRTDAIPNFKSENAILARFEAHLPFSDNGYITVYANFATFAKDKRLPDPWTLGIGYSIPIDNIATSIKTLIN